MKEASKAMRRRWCEDESGVFPWRSIFQGKGIDVGCGDDLLPFEDCQPFDMQHGDANRLGDYFPEGTFDYLHASQCLEHMVDPWEAFRQWLKVVKPGGYLIVTVPDWVAYEGMQWPSQWNGDHKSTWSMIYRGSIAPIHVYVPDFLKGFPVKVNLSRFVDTNYDYAVATTIDQTFSESESVEAFIEFVVQKEGKV